LNSIRLAEALLLAACLSPDCLAQAQPANASGNGPLRTLVRTVAFVPMENVVGPDSYLAALHDKGYRVEAP
jgi:hypothetical protein